jgi:hypothetical protein
MAALIAAVAYDQAYMCRCGPESFEELYAKKEDLCTASFNIALSASLSAPFAIALFWDTITASEEENEITAEEINAAVHEIGTTFIAFVLLWIGTTAYFAYKVPENARTSGASKCCGKMAATGLAISSIITVWTGQRPKVLALPYYSVADTLATAILYFCWVNSKGGLNSEGRESEPNFTSAA